MLMGTLIVIAAVPERLSIVDNSVYIDFLAALWWEFALQLQTGRDLVMQAMIDLSVAKVAHCALLSLLTLLRWCLDGDVNVGLFTRY